MKFIKKCDKELRGITLISLVVTIVVLIILAGVSISMLTGQSRYIATDYKCKRTNRKCN